MFSKIKSFFSRAIYWENFDDQIADYVQYLRGNVLNAGAGDRDISYMVKGRLFNQDLENGIHNANIHIYSPLHKIPVDNGFFDTVFCNAVIEHVENPKDVIKEFYRVLKPGGYLFLSVPFLQPEHLDPTDFQRYTRDGLKKLVEDERFTIIKIEGFLNVYQTIGWIIEEWIKSKKTKTYLILRLFLFPTLRYLGRHSRTHVHTIASAYRVLAQK